MPINVLIADDQTIVREGLRMILSSHDDICVAGEASNGREAITLSGNLNCDVVIMDLAMSGLNGIEATRAIAVKYPALKVIILSMYDTSEYVHRALQAGARGYLLKGIAGVEMVAAIKAVMNGELYLGKGVRSLKPEQVRTKSPLDSLSPREREVLQLVAEGKHSAEIARILGLSDNTPDVYRSRIMRKLGITSTAGLVKFAIQQGVISVG